MCNDNKAIVIIFCINTSRLPRCVCVQSLQSAMTNNDLYPLDTIRDHISSIYPILSDWKEKVDYIDKCMEMVHFGIEYVKKYDIAKQLINEYPNWQSSHKDIQSLSKTVEKFIQLRDMDQIVLERCNIDINSLKGYLQDFQATLISNILALLESSIPINKEHGPLLLNEPLYSYIVLLGKLDAIKVALSHLLKLARQSIYPLITIKEPSIAERSSYYSSIISVLNIINRFNTYDYPLLLMASVDPLIIRSYLMQPWIEDIEQDLIALWKAYFAHINLTQDRYEDLILFQNISLVDQDIILSELSSMGHLMASTVLDYQLSPYYRKKWIPSYLDLEEDYLGKSILKAIEIEQIIQDPAAVVSSVEDSFYILNKILKRAHDTLSFKFFSVAMDRLMTFFHKLYIHKYIQSNLPSRLKSKLGEEASIQNEQVQLFVNSYSMTDTCFAGIMDLLRKLSNDQKNSLDAFDIMHRNIHEIVMKKIQECFKWIFCPLLDSLLNQVFSSSNTDRYSSHITQEGAQPSSDLFIESLKESYIEYKNRSLKQWHIQVQDNIERLSIEHLLLLWESNIYQSSFTLYGAHLLMDEIRSILYYFIQETRFEDIRSKLFHKILYIGHVLCIEQKSDLIQISQEYAFTKSDAESILSLRIDFL